MQIMLLFMLKFAAT